MKEEKKWTNKKTSKQIENELWRIIDTYDLKTLRELFFNSMTNETKINMVNDWHDNDE